MTETARNALHDIRLLLRNIHLDTIGNFQMLKAQLMAKLDEAEGVPDTLDLTQAALHTALTEGSRNASLIKSLEQQLIEREREYKEMEQMIQWRDAKLKGMEEALRQQSMLLPEHRQMLREVWEALDKAYRSGAPVHFEALSSRVATVLSSACYMSMPPQLDEAVIREHPLFKEQTKLLQDARAQLRDFSAKGNEAVQKLNEAQARIMMLASQLDEAHNALRDLQHNFEESEHMRNGAQNRINELMIAPSAEYLKRTNDEVAALASIFCCQPTWMELGKAAQTLVIEYSRLQSTFKHQKEKLANIYRAVNS